MSRTLSRPARYAALGAVLALGLTACATADAESSATATAGEHDHDEDGHDHDEEESESGSTEQASATPRLVMTYDGGIVVVDANSLEVEADIELDGFNRLNSLGDGRHVAVSTTGGFQILDAGTWSQAHGDHYHYYTGEISLTDLMVEAETPGHVVVHDGYSILFDDGTGHVSAFYTSDWTHLVEEGHLDVVREYDAEEAHHGVAVLTE